MSQLNQRGERVEEMFLDGMRYHDIAEELGVGWQYVSQVLSRRGYWQDLFSGRRAVLAPAEAEFRRIIDARGGALPNDALFADLWALDVPGRLIGRIFNGCDSYAGMVAKRLDLRPRAGPKPMPDAPHGRKKICNDTLRKMWAAGEPSGVIAERLGVKYPAVNLAARRLGLPARRAGDIRRVTPAPAKTEAAAPAKQGLPRPEGVDDLTFDVIKAEGRYAALVEVGRRHSVPMVRLMQIWHRVRVSDARAAA